MEVWKDIEGFDGYQVSNLGKVRSTNWGKRGITKNMYLKKHNRGYLQVELVKNSTRKCLLVHRLVAEAFIPNPQDLPQVNHIDENKQNNKVENLEWCTQSQNTRKYVKNHPYAFGGNGGLKPITRIERIVQMDLCGNFIKEWENAVSLKHAYGYNSTSIWECCEGKRKTAYGYKWRYAISK